MYSFCFVFFLSILRPPRATRTDTLFPTRRSSDLFAAFISINLGFINLLPLPMLDGGHLAFYAYEAVRRRPASMQVQEWAFRFGFVAIVLLMLVVTFNDLGSIGAWEDRKSTRLNSSH